LADSTVGETATEGTTGMAGRQWLRRSIGTYHTSLAWLSPWCKIDRDDRQSVQDSLAVQVRLELAETGIS